MSSQHNAPDFPETFNYKDKYYELRLEYAKALDTISALEKIQKKYNDQLTLALQKIMYFLDEGKIDTVKETVTETLIAFKNQGMGRQRAV